MKKNLLLALVLAGAVGTASAWTTVKLLNTVEGVWDSSATTTMTEVSDGSHNFFYYILDSSTITDEGGNYYFRIYVSDNGKQFGAWENDFEILDYKNYGGQENNSNSFKLVTDKSSKYIISVGYWEENGEEKWHFTATKYYGTGTIFFNNTNNFSNPYAYVYCTGEARLTGGWPGTQMASNGDGTYSLSDVNIGKGSKIIISDNGNNQIADQDISGDLVMDGNGTVASQTVTIGSAGYSTFSSAYPVDFTEATGVTAYRATQITEGTHANMVLLTKVSGKVPAATGLVLQGTANSPVTIPTTASAESIGDNNLVATVKTTAITASVGEYYYFLAGDTESTIGFYKITGTENSNAGKAYYRTTTELASDPTAPTARASWIFDDGTQGINSVVNAQGSDVVYDLQGRVAKVARAGLYIKNGKKVIMK